MTEWTKHTGTGKPSELAATQIVEWTTCRDMEVGHYQQSDRVSWFSGIVEYRPALDPDGLPYVSAEGLEPETKYVAVGGDGTVNQFNGVPHFEGFMEMDIWTCSNDPNAWHDCPPAPETHRIPGDPEHSLARVWRK